MEGGGEGGRWGRWKKRITRVFTGKNAGKEAKGSVEELPRIVVSKSSAANIEMFMQFLVR